MKTIIYLVLFFCFLLTVISCSQQVSQTEPLPAEIKIGGEYRFALSMGSGKVTVLETSNGWIKIRDARDEIIWVNPNSIISISEYKGK